MHFLIIHTCTVVGETILPSAVDILLKHWNWKAIVEMPRSNIHVIWLALTNLPWRLTSHFSFDSAEPIGSELLQSVSGFGSLWGWDCRPEPQPPAPVKGTASFDLPPWLTHIKGLNWVSGSRCYITHSSHVHVTHAYHACMCIHACMYKPTCTCHGGHRQAYYWLFQSSALLIRLHRYAWPSLMNW